MLETDLRVMISSVNLCIRFIFILALKAVTYLLIHVDPSVPAKEVNSLTFYGKLSDNNNENSLNFIFLLCSSISFLGPKRRVTKLVEPADG